MSALDGRRLPLGFSQRRTLLVLGDLGVCAGLSALALALGARRSGWDLQGRALGTWLAWLALLGALWVALAWANGLYERAGRRESWLTVVRILQVCGQLVLLWALAYFLLPPWTLVRHVPVFFALGAALAMPAWRWAQDALLRRPAFRRRLLVVGAGVSGRTLVAALRREAPDDFELLGFVDDDPALRDATVAGLPVLGGREALVRLARELRATELALAITTDVHGELLAALMDAREQGVAVVAMPLLYESVTGRVPVEHVGDHWQVALPLGAADARGLYPVAARALALLGGVVLGLLLLLLLPVLAPLILLGSPGPLFFRQRRTGRGGRDFTLYKLRTMVADAERGGAVWASPDDPRVTRIGRFLRRSRLDELPQALNLLRGEMGLVGPRPERPEFVAHLAERLPFYRARHAVRPGMTGWAAIHQGYAASEADALEKLQYDLYYIKRRSLPLDLAILLRTAALVLRMDGR